MRKLDASDADFARDLTALLSSREENTANVAGVVSSLISQARLGGDAALIELTEQFDRHTLTTESLRVSDREIANALSLCSPELMKSLKVAAARIRSYSEKQMPADLDYTDDTGTRLGHRWSAIDAVGLYVPGGTAAYPSSVLMNAIPAKVAGCRRLVMVVPCPDGILNSAVLAAAHVAGIDEIYKIGGAQAVAALAYGTETIKPVDKIVGPGNAWVAEAKRQVFGKVGIDMIAGPSEILVISDKKSNPAWVAADLLSQAEHDPLAQSILITDDEAFAGAVEMEIETILPKLPRNNIAAASWENYGAIILVKNLADGCAIANRIAPEHLELMTENPQKLAATITHAGAIFMGRHTPEAIGDYIAGPSHVLPTSQTARFSSGLSVFDFLKRSSLISCSEKSFEAIREYGEVLAETEGLGAQAIAFRAQIMNPQERIGTIRLELGNMKIRSKEAEHERNVAIADLLDENQFDPAELECGPYDVVLKIEENRLVFDIASPSADKHIKVALPVGPLRGTIRDYFLICESYYDSLKSGSCGKIEAIDMGRRGVHNDGADTLKDMLEARITIDHATARRLFTLICVLHLK